MGDVVGLRDDAVFAHGEPDEQLVDSLENLLAAARSGSLRAMAFAAVSNERAISTSWEGHCDLHDMIAGVGILSHRLLSNSKLDGQDG